MNTDISWMKKGVPVTYCPVYIDGRHSSEAYTGRIAVEPFKIGNPKNDRWVVRIEDMDEKFQQQFGRTVIAIASVKYVKPVSPIEEI